MLRSSSGIPSYAILGVLVSVMSWGWSPGPICGAEVPAATGAPSSQAQVIQQVEFRDMALTDALRLLADQTDLNLTCSAEAGKTRISLFLKNVPAKTAIEELCKAYGLWSRVDPVTGVTRIMTLAEFQHTLGEFRDERTEVFTLLYPNAVDVASAIRSLYADRVRLSFDPGESDDLQNLQDRFARFDVLDRRSQGLGLFSSTAGVTEAGTTQVNINAGSEGSMNSRLSAARSNDKVAGSQRPNTSALTPEQAQAISDLLESQQRGSDQQKALSAYLSRAADIHVTLVRRNNMVIVRTSDQGTMEEISKLVQQLDVPTPLVLLEIKVLSVQLSDDFSSFFDYQFSSPSAGTSGGFTGGDIQPPASDLLNGAARRTAPLTLGGTGLLSGGLAFQYVSDNFRVRMQMLSGKNRVTQLATPMLLTANNEVSRLFIGEERPIVRNISSQAVVNNNTTTVVPNTTIEFRPVGTTLLITPNINADRTVTLRILQENSRIEPGAATIPVVNSNGTVTNQPVDVVAARTLSGTIVAKDGLTLAVGGLIEEEVTHTRTSVPILGDIPLVGLLFRRDVSGRSRQELIILIRPYVLNTPTESEAAGRKLVEELSIHPMAPDARGTLNTYNPKDVPMANPPETRKDLIFRFHSGNPDGF